MRPWRNTLLCAVLFAGCATSKVVKFEQPERRETVVLLLDGHGKVTQRSVASWREQDKEWASLATYDGKGVLCSKAVFVHTPTGIVSEVQFFAADGTLRGRAKSDASGHVSGVELFDQKGQPIAIPYEDAR
jgi:hypothetical protein